MSVCECVGCVWVCGYVCGCVLGRLENVPTSKNGVYRLTPYFEVKTHRKDVCICKNAPCICSLAFPCPSSGGNSL